MPLYEYQCDSCGETFEAQQRMSEDPLTDCKLCGATGTVRRLVGGGTGLIFKGSGFYITDYKGGNASNGKDSGSSESDSKPETASKAEKPAGETKSSSSDSSTKAPAASKD